MPAEEFLHRSRRLGLEENAEARTWVQNVYFDTADRAMPLGLAARTRRYIGEPDENFVSTGEKFIDIGYTSFEDKSKRRFKGTAQEVVDKLNAQFPIRVYDFRPTVAVQYLRQIFTKKDVRVSLDSDISLFSVDADGMPKRIGILSPAVVEVKYAGPEGYEVFSEMASQQYAKLGPSKHYLPYNALYLTDRPRETFRQLGCFSELPGKEIELKFDAVSHEAFMRFYVSIAKGELGGYSILEACREPPTLESINDYKVLPDGAVARVMYMGVGEPRYIVKDKGTFTSGNVLIRKEEKVEGSVVRDNVLDVTSLPSIGISRRIKRLSYVRSNSGLIYNISVDLSQAQKRNELIQVEIEYIRSEKSHETPMETVLDEIGQLGNHLESKARGLVRRSNLRKEDWISGVLRG